MPLTIPPRKRAADEPREMVRVMLKPNDMRSYERSEAEELIAQTPGAYIVGEQTDAPAPAETAARTAARRPAANRSRQTKADAAEAAEKPADAETKAD